MGIHGWHLLSQDAQTLLGTVTKHEWNGGITGDGDWSLFVRPDNPDDPLLSNRSGSGRTNQSGLIECEVEPTIDPTSDQDSFSASEDQYFSPLVGKHVKIWGPWVADCSHAWNDDDLPVKDCDVGKTEIHPIFSIEALLSESESAKEIGIFVFSDDSETIKPPNSGQNITVSFAIPFPATPPDILVPKFHLVSETHRARTAAFSIANNGDQFVLQGMVESGTGGEGKGFYHAVIRLSFVFHSVRKSLQGKGDPSQGLRSLHPWFDGPRVSVRDTLINMD